MNPETVTLEQLERQQELRAGLRAVGSNAAARLEYLERIPMEVVLQDHPMARGLIHAYRDTGRYADAIRVATAFLDEAKRLGVVADIAAGSTTLGVTHFYAGDLGEADRLLNESLVIRESRLGGAGAHLPLNNLAIIAHLRGRWAEAVSWGTRAIAMAVREGDTLNIAKGYQNLGMYYRDLKRFEDAVVCFERSGDLLRLVNNPTASIAGPELYLEQAVLYLRMGDVILARVLARKGSEDARRLSAVRIEPEAQRVMGNVALAAGDLAAARELLEAALDGAVRYKNPLLEAEALEELATVLLRQGDRPSAERMAEASAEIYRRIGTDFRADAALRRLETSPAT